MNKIDGIFKKKLEDLALEPRSEAWVKLEAKLSKKNSGLIWFRSAAALLLMGLLITSIIWLQRDENQQVAEQLKNVNPSKISKENKLKDTLSQSTPREANKITEAKRKSNSIKAKTINPSTVPPTVKEIEPEPPKIEILSTETVAEVTIKEKPIVIEYTLESIIPQKKEAPIVAENDEKKKGLQKALDFAREAKNSDSPLGGIRQAKDDLFALNFKKDKQKKQ